jgi:excisionase family DNA binding protein
MSTEKRLPRDRVLTMQEACAFLQVSRVTIRRWIDHGRLRTVRAGRVLGFRQADLLAPLD